MKNSYLFILIILCFYSCKKDSKQEKLPLEDINLVINSSQELDSISLKPVNSDKEIFPSNYNYKSDTLRFNLNDNINNLYFVNFYGKQHLPRLPIWLDGEKVIVDIEIKKYPKVSKVKNSPLYLNSQEYSSTLKELYKDDKKNKEAINEYLFNKIKEHQTSPFVFVPAEIFVYNNRENEAQLRRLDSILQQLSPELKKSPLNVQSRLKEHLSK